VLQSSASPHDKDAACVQFKRIGTVESIPALSTLLIDEQLSHSARYVLEAMSAPEAGRALIDALPKTSGSTKEGIIMSLGTRRETRAVPTLAGLSSEPDPTVAIAAATALGKIGGPEAIKVLQTARWPTIGTVHDAVVDGLLRCANELLAFNQGAKAVPIFQRIYENEQKDKFRVAAYRGMVLSSGTKG